MISEFLQKKGASTELAQLMIDLLDAVEEISGAIDHSVMGSAGTQNVFGEEQAALDVRAEKIMSEHAKNCPFVVAYGSEELDELMDANPDGQFSVFYDPLDGSSLIDVNLSVGTIVGVYEGANVLGRTPRSQVAALFAVYGPRVTVMLTVGNGTHELVLVGPGEWEVFKEEVVMKGDKKYFAPGNLRATKEREDYFKLVETYMREQYTLRYSGGMVPDINHILKKGNGVFLYPGMPSAPDGKLRLMYECGPMAMLMEQAGGAASNGKEAILDLPIESLVQRTPIFIGDSKEVERAVEALST